jgi:protein-tyrosine-phosphatase
VVFVCEHGSAKSVVAASLFERMARDRGVAIRALSRGTVPDAAVPPAVVSALRNEGIDVASFRPGALAEPEVAAAAAVVAIGVDLGDLATKAGARLERWDDIPPVSTRYPEARKAMLARLDSLLQRLRARDPTGSGPQ